MRNQFMSMRWLIVLVCVVVMAGGCENSGKKLKLPSLEGAPEQLGAPSR